MMMAVINSESIDFVILNQVKMKKIGTLELDLNMIVNVDNDVEGDTVPLVPEFEDAFRFSLTISHDWTLSNRQSLEVVLKVSSIIDQLLMLMAYICTGNKIRSH
uniref:Uncharacterized protein n=1 Tax=Salix viminalis TaxID=40686 RepID=A0A6N2MSE9_SALVM